MALDDVTSFLRLKDVTITCLLMLNSPTTFVLVGLFQCNGGKLEKTEGFKSVFVV